MDMNKEQIYKMFDYMEYKQPVKIRKDFFRQLGIECYNTRNVKKWIQGFNGNIQALLDWVNVSHASPYWEKLEFNPDRTVLTLTGKPAEKCVCGFAGSENPPKSLCDYCCTSFQENLFGEIFRKRVKVNILKSLLHGDGRCDTEILIPG